MIKLIPLRTPLLKKRVLEQLFNSIRKIKIENGDILVVASKIVALAEGEVVSLKEIKPSKKAEILAKQFRTAPSFTEIVAREADSILGGVKGAILTLKNKMLVANAGVDNSNIPKGKVILWPKNPEKSAQKIKSLIKKVFKKEIGVVIADSCCHPLRRGTASQAIGISGFLGIEDERGKLDLFGKKMHLTLRNLADQLADAALLLMGERKEKIPAVLIKGLKIKRTNKKNLTQKLLIKPNKDLFKDLMNLKKYEKRID